MDGLYLPWIIFNLLKNEGNPKTRFWVSVPEKAMDGFIQAQLIAHSSYLNHRHGAIGHHLGSGALGFIQE